MIGSGTCATGCLLERNQTNNTNIWLNDGDVNTFEIENLSSLTNTVKIV